MRNINQLIIAFSVLSACFAERATAQLNPLQAQYYSNRYLANPAMAGIEKGMALGLTHRSQFTDIPGRPVTENFTLDYGFNKVGLGLNVSLDKAGLQRYTRALASYAYHLQLNNQTSSLHFGLSAGIINQRLTTDGLVGNPADNLLGLYNQRETHFDGDVGIAFTSEKITAELALPNLRNLLWHNDGNVANLPTFYSALGYKIAINDTELEPKAAFRRIKGFENIWDAGAQLCLATKQVMLNAMYHSSGSTTVGIAMDYRKKYLIGFSHTLQTGNLSNSTNGDFEVNLRVRL